MDLGVAGVWLAVSIQGGAGLPPSPQQTLLDLAGPMAQVGPP